MIRRVFIPLAVLFLAGILVFACTKTPLDPTGHGKCSNPNEQNESMAPRTGMMREKPSTHTGDNFRGKCSKCHNGTKYDDDSE